MMEFSAWLGRQEERRDRLDASRSMALFAAMGRQVELRDGDPLPPLHHWLHFWDVRTPAQTGADGHPKRGGFLPPIALPRRMWAGGHLIFRRPLVLGADIRRVSTIDAITEKRGRSGHLVFVTVRHEIFDEAGLAIEEEQDLVYREPAAARSVSVSSPDHAAEPDDEARRSIAAEVKADPILLFRYSALTLNSHRIHYDRPYSVEEEGYEDLVVQGPLQATLLADLAASRLDRPLATFRFRGMAPAVTGHSLLLHAENSEGRLDLWTSQRGIRAMAASAECR